MQPTNNNNSTTNRIEAAQEQWDRQHEKYLNRYGPTVVKDRDYQLVKRDMHRQIYDQFKNDRTLSLAEKMDLRILKGQVNQMDRGLYTRTGRALRAVGNIIQSVLKAAVMLPLQIGSLLVFRRPLPNNNALTTPRIPIAPHPQTAGQHMVSEVGYANSLTTVDNGKTVNQKPSPEGTPAKVVQRNFRNNVRKVLDAEKSKGKRV
jgi:hypothetical protein